MTPVKITDDTPEGYKMGAAGGRSHTFDAFTECEGDSLLNFTRDGLRYELETFSKKLIP